MHEYKVHRGVFVCSSSVAPSGAQNTQCAPVIVGAVQYNQYNHSQGANGRPGGGGIRQPECVCSSQEQLSGISEGRSNTADCSGERRLLIAMRLFQRCVSRCVSRRVSVCHDLSLNTGNTTGEKR